MSSIVLAKRKNKPFDMAMDHIWLSIEFDYIAGSYVLVHFMNHNKPFGGDYARCNNISELNDIKSAMLNNKFKIDWNIFDIAMKHLSVGVD